MSSIKRRQRIAVYSLVFIFSLSLLVPFSGLLLTDGAATAAEFTDNNPRADYWREVRQSNEGYTTAQGREAGVLINDGGQDWRRIRNGWVANFMPWLLLVVFSMLVLFHFLKGKKKGY
jgi:formate dehydrogenase subunit gamma